MIIFGWGHQKTDNIGPTFKQHCNHCNNEKYWLLSKISNWFTLFFIPIFPYEIKYFLSCPICQYGLNIERKHVEELKPLAEANQLLLDGKISKADYEKRLNIISSSDPYSEPIIMGGEVKTEADAPLLKFCANCGNGVTKNIKFCGNCGAPRNTT